MTLQEMPEPSDSQLIELARRGDQRAFARIVERHQGRVAATVRGMIPNQADAEDAAQEVFLRLHRSLDRFEGRSSLSTYLTRIAINQALNTLKKRRRWLEFFTGTTEHTPEPRWEGDLDEPDVEGREWVEAQLQRLSPDHRAVVVLRVINGLSTEEAAAALGVPPGTIMSRLSRSLEKLRAGLEAEARPDRHINRDKR